MSRPKKKLSDFNQIDGKIRAEENDNAPESEYEITSLNQLWGDTGLSRYSTTDLDEYQASLAEMNSAEIRRHAVEVAHVVPALSRERTEKRLVLEFKKHISSYRVPKQVKVAEKPASKELLKIMAETK